MADELLWASSRWGCRVLAPQWYPGQSCAGVRLSCALSHPWFQSMCVMWSLARLQDALAVWHGPVVAPGNISSSASGLPVSWEDGNGGLYVTVPLVLGVCCSFSQQSEKGKVLFSCGGYLLDAACLTQLSRRHIKHNCLM